MDRLRRYARRMSIALAALAGVTFTGCMILETKERELVYRPGGSGHGGPRVLDVAETGASAQG